MCDPIESAPSTAKGKRKKKKQDKDADQDLIESYKTAGDGFPADYLLCDPDLNKAFVSECKKRGLDGNAYIWNRYLLQLRKASKLPHSTRRPPQLSAEQMDQLGYAAEVAWRLIAIDYQKTLDEILCSPDFSEEFDRLASHYGPQSQEVKSVDFRRAAISIRKRSNKARKTAIEKHSGWIDHIETPKLLSIDDDMSSFDLPGVYVLRSGESSVYAGETKNIQARIQELLQCEKWSALEIDSVEVIPHNGNLAALYALKAALAIREHPLLNCRLLMYDSELPKRSTKVPQ